MKNIRVYINKKIKIGFLELDESQTHYIKNVMRLKIGENFNIFNALNPLSFIFGKKYPHTKNEKSIVIFIQNKPVALSMGV